MSRGKSMADIEYKPAQGLSKAEKQASLRVSGKITPMDVLISNESTPRDNEDEN